MRNIWAFYFLFFVKLPLGDTTSISQLLRTVRSPSLFSFRRNDKWAMLILVKTAAVNFQEKPLMLLAFEFYEGL